MMRNLPLPGILLCLASLVIVTVACSNPGSPPTGQPVPTHPQQDFETLEQPTDTAAPANSTQVPELVTSPINVREVRGYADESNYWFVFGLISNDSDQAVKNIEINIQLQDANGVLLYQDTISPSITALAAGELSPFVVYTFQELKDVQRILANIVSYEATELVRANLDFSGITLWYAPSFKDVYLSGNITNHNDQPVKINSLAAILRGTDGAIVSANTAYPFINHLNPGGSAPFSILLNAPNGEGAALTNYSLYLDAETSANGTVYDLITAEEHYGYLDAYDDFHLVGTISNNSSTSLNTRLIAGIFDEKGNCIDSSSLYLPVAIGAGEIMPYDFDLWGALDSSEDAYNAATQYEIYIDWYSTSEAYLPPVLITTTDDTTTFDGSTATFTGNVLNNSDKDLNSATVIITLYNNGTGELIATDFAYVSGPITINGTVPYTAYLYPQENFDPAIVEFTINAYGQ